MSFEDYTTAILRAFCVHPKQMEVIKRKQEILAGITEYHNFNPESVLYVGFNPAILGETAENIFVTYVSQESQDYLLNSGVKFTYINESKFDSYYKKFDVVIALDEYFTFAISDHDQKKKVSELCDLTKEYLITTCKDYKNQEFKDREFSIPVLIRNNQKNSIYVEFHNHDLANKNIWQTNLYEINDNILENYGSYLRHAMYFKQLAKFSSDSGATGFSVHKNLMYKSLIKKNYEHVISIQF
jgi:hypothetical protein